MSGLAQDRTTEPVSRGQILRRELGEGENRFPVSYQVYPYCTLLKSADHTHMVFLHKKLCLHTRRALLVVDG